MFGFVMSTFERNGEKTRRSFITMTGAAAATSLALAACKKEQEEGDEDVGAVEDLMREHGVIRRVLVVYREAAMRLRAPGGSVEPEPLQRAARLMRKFGEDYHEKALEEAHIFPLVKQRRGPAAKEIDALVAQHQRGRELTDYVIGMTRAPIAVDAANELAAALDSFSRMYELHAAHEDTIVFVAWKEALTRKQREKMGDLFEDIEHKTFGKDGFDDAVGMVSDIEQAMGIDLASFTPTLARAT
jgi:hemerythrin-like domain-containing protein